MVHNRNNLQQLEQIPWWTTTPQRTLSNTVRLCCWTDQLLKRISKLNLRSFFGTAWLEWIWNEENLDAPTALWWSNMKSLWRLPPSWENDLWFQYEDVYNGLFLFCMWQNYLWNVVLWRWEKHVLQEQTLGWCTMSTSFRNFNLCYEFHSPQKVRCQRSNQKRERS